MDSLPPAPIPGSVLQRSNAARGMGQSGSDAVAIDMDSLDNRPQMSNDLSQMQIVEQQVRDLHTYCMIALSFYRFHSHDEGKENQINFRFAD